MQQIIKDMWILKNCKKRVKGDSSFQFLRDIAKSKWKFRDMV